MSTNIADADELVKKATKHIRKTLFHKPKYDEAASEYEGAAKIYSHEKLYELAAETWKCAIDAYEKAQNENFAGRCAECLAELFVEQANGQSNKTEAARLLKEAASFFEKAAVFYRLAIKPKKHADSLIKSTDALVKAETQTGMSAMKIGTILPDGLYDTCFKRMIEAVEALREADEDNKSVYYTIPDIYQSLILFSLRCGNLIGAIATEKLSLGYRFGSNEESISYRTPFRGGYDPRQNIFSVINQPGRSGRAALEIIILCLYANEFWKSLPSTNKNADLLKEKIKDEGGSLNWANKEMDELCGNQAFGSGTERFVAMELIDAVSSGDPKRLEDATKSRSELQFLISEISRMAKKLIVAGTSSNNVPNAKAKNMNQSESPIDVVEEYIDPDEDIR